MADRDTAPRYVYQKGDGLAPGFEKPKSAQEQLKEQVADIDRMKEVLPEYSYVNYKTGSFTPVTRGQVEGNRFAGTGPSDADMMLKIKRYHEDPEFRALAKENGWGDNNFSSLSSLASSIGDGLQSMAEGTVDAAVKIAPTAALFGGMMYAGGLGSGLGGGSTAGTYGGYGGGPGGGLASVSGSNALAGSAAAGSNALASNPMGSGFTGTGPGVATTGAASGASAPMIASSMAGVPAATNAISTAGNAANTVGNAVNSGAPDWLNPALIGGSSLISGYLSHDATEKGIDEIKRQYDTTRADQEPWRQAGVGALDKLTNFDTNTILNDPMYQLANEEGLRAVNRGNSARGLNLSGNALIDEARTGADIATGYGTNIWNRQAGLAGIGQTATNTLANVGQNSANNLANLYNQQGEGLNNALQGGIANYLTYDANQNYRNPYMTPYKYY